MFGKEHNRDRSTQIRTRIVQTANALQICITFYTFIASKNAKRNREERTYERN